VKNSPEHEFLSNLDFADADIFEAMKAIEGYIDVTPEDFREIYRLAYHRAFQRITSSLTAKDIMTADVLSVPADMSLKKVAGIMAEHGVSGVPVVTESGTVGGVISEKDFLARMGGGTSKSFMGVVAECLKGKGCVAVSVRAQHARDLMSSPALTVESETTVMEIATLFTEKKINRVPVVGKDGKLIGIVSRTDVVTSLLQHTLERKA